MPRWCFLFFLFFKDSTSGFYFLIFFFYFVFVFSFLYLFHLLFIYFFVCSFRRFFLFYFDLELGCFTFLSTSLAFIFCHHYYCLFLVLLVVLLNFLLVAFIFIITVYFSYHLRVNCHSTRSLLLHNILTNFYCAIFVSPKQLNYCAILSGPCTINIIAQHIDSYLCGNICFP